MKQALLKFGRACAALALAAASGAVLAQARYDVPLRVTEKFSGNVNFVGTQASMRTKANRSGTNDACAVVSASTEITASLQGVPANSRILSAQLYWAGSAATPDYEVTFENTTVRAADDRQYRSNTTGNHYFSGAADVTPLVKGNGTYRFKNLTINAGSPYCAPEGVLGGFALLVVYANDSEPYRNLNLYEGFQYIHNPAGSTNVSVTLNLKDFKIPDLSRTRATGRLGHITWEGDPNLSEGGEILKFNNYEMSDASNPSGNQFNSVSSMTPGVASRGIDFDIYTLDEPVIKTGQTSATTVYRSGQDLVLLSAEIIAVPNVPPTVDLKLEKTRTSELVVGLDASYTLSVTNLGPGSYSGASIVDYLPSGLRYQSAAGTGWSCVYYIILYCEYAGTLAKGQAAPPLTVVARVEKTGTLTNTASVLAPDTDPNTANNTDSDTGVAEQPSADLSFVFTDRACTANIAIGNASQPCKPFAGPVVAGASTQVFVTAIANGVPVKPASTLAKPSLRFGLSCLNPAAGKLGASYGVALPQCAASGAVPAAGTGVGTWGAAQTLDFSAAPSVALNFVYHDVGKVQLYLQSTATSKTAASLPFVSRPARLAFTLIERNRGRFANPGAATGADPMFAVAGEPFTVSVIGATLQGAATPSFGAEGATVTLGVGKPLGTAEANAMRTMPDLGGEAWTLQNGVFTAASLSWGEVGILRLWPRLEGEGEFGNYLGTGPVDSVDVRNVGRFVPAYFKTVASGQFACLAKMACAARGDGAVYSGQPFTVTVVPMAQDGEELDNFSGPFARDITVSAYDAPAGTTLNPNGGSLATSAGAGVVVPKAGIVAGAPIGVKPAYTLPKRFSYTRPNALDWTAPTPVFLRAVSKQEGTEDVITSLRASAAATQEGGVTVLNGRLRLSNGAGSELLKLPVTTEAQYWTGSAWANNTVDDSSEVSFAQAGNLSFLGCKRALADGSGCKSVLGPVAGPAYRLSAGRGAFAIRAPGAGNIGSALLVANNPAWLPSTQTLLAFGGYHNSRLIFLREMY